MNYDFEEQCELEEMAERLAGSGEFRVLRKVPERYTVMAEGGAVPEGRCIAFIDCETTGLDVTTHKMIELAIMLVFVDDEGELTGHIGPVSWLEDLGVTLDPRISLLTGLVNDDLAGHRIDDTAAASMIERADLCIAHNARFDAAWIEQRYPHLAGKPWACSASDIDWLMLGFEGRAQQHLLMQHGYFANAHRAGDDVWSLYIMLREKKHGAGRAAQRSHLSRLIEAADTDNILVEAVNAPFERKDELKARSYRWNPDKKVWTKEIRQNDLAVERSWFADNRLPKFNARMISARQRHR